LSIDTKAKRASVQAYTLGLMRPPPDGTVDAGDRATVCWFYSGLTYVPAALRFINIVQRIARSIVMRIAFDPVSTKKNQQ